MKVARRRGTARLAAQVEVLNAVSTVDAVRSAGTAVVLEANEVIFFIFR